jgi:hypothetical protein
METDVKERSSFATRCEGAVIIAMGSDDRVDKRLGQLGELCLLYEPDQ